MKGRKEGGRWEARSAWKELGLLRPSENEVEGRISIDPSPVRRLPRRIRVGFDKEKQKSERETKHGLRSLKLNAFPLLPLFLRTSSSHPSPNS